MESVNQSILTVNAGSSSIKFALFESNDGLRQILKGAIDGVGLAKGSFSIKCLNAADNFSRPALTPDHKAAVSMLVDWIQQRTKGSTLSAIGHRVVHGGEKYWQPQRITPKMIDDLRKLMPFDPEHLPEEILLIETFDQRFKELPQIACFDTAFHHEMPRVAQILPLPRRYEAKGLRRYGFHGLSYAYSLLELERLAGATAATGRIILCHLGNGASICAVHDRHCLDTSMAFTPTAGLVMGTRSGDIDPGLVSFLARTEKMNASQFDQMVNHASGLIGVSETSSDMRDLLAREKDDLRAAEAVSLFCYQAKKWIGAYVAVLGGLDTLVFSGGIGENAPPVRARICQGLGFLGVELNDRSNQANAGLISTDTSAVAVRVIQTNEEYMIAKYVLRLLKDNL